LEYDYCVTVFCEAIVHSAFSNEYLMLLFTKSAPVLPAPESSCPASHALSKALAWMADLEHCNVQSYFLDNTSTITDPEGMKKAFAYTQSDAPPVESGNAIPMELPTMHAAAKCLTTP
jgi:hypothetical protein